MGTDADSQSVTAPSAGDDPENSAAVAAAIREVAELIKPAFEEKITANAAWRAGIIVRTVLKHTGPRSAS